MNGSGSTLERMQEQPTRPGRALEMVGTWEWLVASNRVEWSDALFRIYDIEPDEFDASFEGYLSRVHPEDREHARRSPPN